MRYTLRNKIEDGLYEKEFEECIRKGYSFQKIMEYLNISHYAFLICKWHIYNKYDVSNKKDLLKKIT